MKFGRLLLVLITVLVLLLICLCWAFILRMLNLLRYHVCRVFREVRHMNRMRIYLIEDELGNQCEIFALCWSEAELICRIRGLNEKVLRTVIYKSQ